MKDMLMSNLPKSLENNWVCTLMGFTFKINIGLHTWVPDFVLIPNKFGVDFYHLNKNVSYSAHRRPHVHTVSCD